MRVGETPSGVVPWVGWPLVQGWKRRTCELPALANEFFMSARRRCIHTWADGNEGGRAGLCGREFALWGGLATHGRGPCAPEKCAFTGTRLETAHCTVMGGWERGLLARSPRKARWGGTYVRPENVYLLLQDWKWHINLLKGGSASQVQGRGSWLAGAGVPVSPPPSDGALEPFLIVL